jgi:hypothetical protein
MGTTVTVPQLPKCDFCKEDPTKDDAYHDVDAHYDGKTVFGSWAYMCIIHFNTYGTGLGTGIGQRLILEGNDSETD